MGWPTTMAALSAAPVEIAGHEQVARHAHVVLVRERNLLGSDLVTLVEVVCIV
jgi:hypothetical protein